MTKPTLSVVIVNYKVRDMLAQTIRSLKKANGYPETEVIVVDNNSNDGSEELLKEHFPEVIWVGLKTNVGFGSACNIGASRANAPILLMLNPDTIVSCDTLTKGLAFFKEHPKTGIMGPKVLNQDGSFQYQCRRSFPTPLNALSYMTGLYKLFPKNRALGAYSMTWANTESTMQVDAVSGSCFFIPTALYEEIGGFDEAFFMYGEDLDICAQVKEHGYEVWYAPITEIIHFKGKSSAQKKIESRLAFYKAMIIFSKKYGKSYGAFLPKGAIHFAIAIQALINIITIMIKQSPIIIIDMAIINIVLPLVTLTRYNFTPHPLPYIAEPLSSFVVHLIINISFLCGFGILGHYRNRTVTTAKTFYGAGLSILIFMGSLFIFRNIAFSRLAFLSAGLLIATFMILWRLILPQISSYYQKYLSGMGKTLILGHGNEAKELLHYLSEEGTIIRGIIWSSEEEKYPADFEGYPVIGTIANLREVIVTYSPNTLVIASDSSWYSTIIENLSAGTLKGVTIKWLPLHSTIKSLTDLKEFSL